MRPLKTGLLAVAAGYGGYALAAFLAPNVPLIGELFGFLALLAVFVGFLWMQREPLTVLHRKFLIASMVCALVGSVLPWFAPGGLTALPRIVAAIIGGASVACFAAAAALASWPFASRRARWAWYAVAAWVAVGTGVVIASAAGAALLPPALAQTYILAGVAFAACGAILPLLASRPIALAVLHPSAAMFAMPAPPPQVKAKRKIIRLGKVRTTSNPSPPPMPGPSPQERLRSLEERFKRGEIDEWTYLDKRQEIEGR